MERYLYHLTDKAGLAHIMQDGLWPLIGERASLCGEKEAMLYLCRHRDVPFWEITLGQHELVRVDVEKAVRDGAGFCEDLKDEDNFYEYDDYAEYAIRKNIEPKYIAPCRSHKLSKDRQDSAMKELCLSFLYTIRNMCLWFARQAHDPDQYDGEDMAAAKTSFLVYIATLRRLEYSVLTKKEIRKELQEMGDGGCSICDTCLDTGRRLYEQLLYYTDDQFTEIRRELNAYICKNLKGCLDLNTGGWAPY